MEDKPVLAGLAPYDLKTILSSYPPFRSIQVHEGICSGAKKFDELSSLPLSLRRELDEKYSLLAGKVSSEQQSADGTVKLGITLDDGVIIECVLLLDGKERKTACLSTQAGCGVGCIFCKTGSMALYRDLNYKEIISQYLYLYKKGQKPSHIVVMGMGEPLLNLIELRKALVYFTDKSTLNISKRRITLSTCGIVEGIESIAKDGPDIRLAFSLVSARQDLRDRLIPVSNKNPLPLIKKALKNYQQKHKHRITLEMVLLKNINTGLEDIKAAAEFAGGLDTVFNIIPWNEAEGLYYDGEKLETPSQKEVNEYKKQLSKLGFNVTERYKKGSEVKGACGQLAAN